MPTFDINRNVSGTAVYRASIEAATYRQEGDYFVFYADASRTRKVLTAAASAVTTIDTVTERR
ncbi:hypothetical protein [uncultured Agrococcus sp.]|uniref:hypothetical protein n=1 Tax=uncultured Agrococcus sp. TaxID=382258 RepID=UPI0025D27F38|nr:hypothetical protein [uncultured Agrococcus sp.]